MKSHMYFVFDTLCIDYFESFFLITVLKLIINDLWFLINEMFFTCDTCFILIVLFASKLIFMSLNLIEFVTIKHSRYLIMMLLVLIISFLDHCWIVWDYLIWGAEVDYSCLCQMSPPKRCYIELYEDISLFTNFRDGSGDRGWLCDFSIVYIKWVGSSVATSPKLRDTDFCSQITTNQR